MTTAVKTGGVKRRPVLCLVDATPAPRPYEFDPALRGYHTVYRSGEVNHCPGCGRSHWYMGRFSAECAFCATVLPFAVAGAGL